MANSAMPMSCGRSPSATAETMNAASVSHEARRIPSPRLHPDEEETAEDDADEGRAEDDQAGPAAELIDARRG